MHFQTLAQCESRAHRIGQMSPVVCRYLLAKGTIDDYMWNMVKGKQDVLSKAGIFSEDLTDATHSTVSVTCSVSLHAHGIYEGFCLMYWMNRCKYKCLITKEKGGFAPMVNNFFVFLTGKYIDWKDHHSFRATEGWGDEITSNQQ